MLSYFRLGASYPRTRLREVYPSLRRSVLVALSLFGVPTFIRRRITLFGNDARRLIFKGNDRNRPDIVGNDGRRLTFKGNDANRLSIVGNEGRRLVLRGQ